jgi:hypothetical protein
MVFSSHERSQIREAFLNCSRDGYSLDRCIADDELRRRVVSACEKAVPGRSEQEYLWDLQNQRKASLLGKHATKRDSFRHREYCRAAAIAARDVEVQHNATVDRLLCDPAIRKEFDRIATEIAPAVEPVRLRLAALALRKTSKLKP